MSDPAVEYNQRLILGVTTVCLILGYLSYALRLYARRISNATFWYDDYLMAVGLFFSTIPCICNYVGLRYGFGQHAATLPETYPSYYSICLYTLEVAWMLGSTTIKYSILLFYWRLFPNKHFRWTIYAVAVFVLACFIAGFTGFIMQCLPPAGFWDHDLKPHCVDQDPLYIAIATLGLVGDIVILILPLPVVWSLKASRHQKVGLSIIFLLGSFVCVISFCRLFSLNRINPADITWTNLAPGLWTMAENQIGVVSGNLPCMRPLFMRLGARVRKLRGGYESKDETNNTAKFRSNGFTRMSEHQKGYPVGLTSAAMAMRGDPDLEFEMGLPMHGISVKTDVEQRIDNASEHSESSQARINRPAPPWREPTTSSAM